MKTAPTPPDEALCARLAAWLPASVLAVGDVATEAARAHVAAFPDCRLDLLDLGAGAGDQAGDGAGDLAAARARLARVGRFDAAVVSGVEAPEILGRLRDLHAARVCALADGALEPGSPRARVPSALGYVRTGAPLAGGEALYEFDIDRYKRTPDWLNARHWAHPERWDKERW